MNLDPAEWYGKVISERLTAMADDHQRIADRLRRLAADVPRIGQPQGVSVLTATDLVTQALGYLARNASNPAGLVKAAADYERDVFGPRPTEEGT